MKSSQPYPLLLNCSFFSRLEYLERIQQALKKDTLTHIVTLNAEMVVESQKNDEFRRAIDTAELKIPDGSSLLWAREYITKHHVRCHSGLDPESTCLDPGSGAGMTSYFFIFFSLIKFLFSAQQPLTGVDSIFDICEAVERNNGSVFLLGGTAEEAQGTQRVLQKKYPRLSIIILDGSTPSNSLLKRGRERDSFPFQGKAGLGEKVSVVFVALGAPKQTLWIELNRRILEEAGVKIAIGVGGAFAMISGILPRAPLFMRRHHLEWLWRLILEPARIKRIWNAIIIFPRIVRGYPH